MASVRVIHKAAPIRDDGILRKTVKKFYAVKGTILVQKWACRQDIIEFINIGIQITDQVCIKLIYAASEYV